MGENEEFCTKAMQQVNWAHEEILNGRKVYYCDSNNNHRTANTWERGFGEFNSRFGNGEHVRVEIDDFADLLELLNVFPQIVGLLALLVLLCCGCQCFWLWITYM